MFKPDPYPGSTFFFQITDPDQNKYPDPEPCVAEGERDLHIDCPPSPKKEIYTFTDN